ncbi:hypothetical protein JL721_13082 [Aureococcus anophagefferens]|nr:hypothetical protein JL721_13082 [Aureococcus anophagefferens]
MAKDMRGLEVGQRERLTTTQTDILTVALTASQFTGTFGDVKLETLDVTIKHLVFVESSQPADSRELPKPRTPALDEPTALKDAEKETPTVLIDKGSNFVVLFKLSQPREAPRRRGAKVGDVRLFGSVPMICAALSSTALPLLKPQFMKARDGLAVRAFVDILFKQLLGVEPRLRDALCDAREASSVVSLLHELFRQIDINGDQLVDWEEFTNHTISSGMMAGLYGADEFTVSYELDLGYSPTSSGGPSAQTLVAALSDHAIHLLTEQLSSAGKHRTYKSAGVIVTHSLHRMLVWSPTADRLFSVDTYSKLYNWSLDSAVRSQKFASPPFAPHGDILMDAIFIKEKGLLATCGLDKKIKLWGIENLRPRGTLLGHKLGVRAISYAQSVLISGGFDNEAIVWDITSHEILCTMSGHQHAIGTVEIIAPSAESVCVVTLDDSGECRYWRLTNHGSRVECIDCFKLPFTDPSGPTRSVVMPWNRKHVVDDFPDLFFGGSRVYHMVPVKTMREFAPPSSSIYNSTSYQFVSAVGNTVHVWDSRTGRYLERFRVDKREISSMCFDMPRMRRVFLGTESGAIATPTTSRARSSRSARPTTGRRLHVLKDVKSSLSVLGPRRTRAQGATGLQRAPVAHRDGRLRGGLVLWDFQTLQQHALIRLEGPAAACAVLDPYPLLATGDTDGVVRLWQLGLDAGYVTVDPLCVMGPPEDCTIGNPAAADRRPGSPARESNSTPSITGLAFLHKHRLHDGAAIEGSFKGDRARRATLRHLSADAAKSASTCPPFASNFKPYRKVLRDMQRCDEASQVLTARPGDCPAFAADARSGDGFQRLWDPRTLRALGEFELPNRLEDDAKRTIPEKKDWDYFLKEAPAVTADDERVARELLRATAPKKVSLRTRFKRAVKRVMTLGAFGGVVEIEDGHEKTEEEILEDRQAAPADARRQSVPLQRVEKFAASAEKHGTNAFSDKSINGGLKAGLFDVEGYQQLKGIARFPERRTAYARRVDGGPSEDLPVADDEPHLKRSQSLITLKKTSKLNARRELAEDVVPLVEASALPRRRDDDGSASSDDESRSSAAHLSRSTSRHMERMAAAMQAADGQGRRPSRAPRRSSSIYRGGGRGSVAGAPAKVDIEQVVKPHYTMADVESFRDSFNFVDVDLSGMINMEEWFLFLGRMNQKLSPIESQLLFLHIDKDRDGEIQGSKRERNSQLQRLRSRPCEITMRELLAIVFQKATAKQLNTMHRHLWDLHLRDATERKQRDIEKLVKKKQKEMFTDVPGHEAADAGA